MFGLFVFVLFVLAVLKIYAVISVGRMRCYKCLVGKTALVTGGNKGIGYETSLALASRGCRVIIACRSPIECVRQKIIEETGNPNIVAMKLDLASFASIRKFAQELNEKEERLDILINNAGVGHLDPAYTEDKIINVLQVNYLGPFLLTHLLVDLLKKSSPSRVVFLTSILCYHNNLTVENINELEEQNLPLRYCNSKLCLVIATKILAQRLEDYGITVNCVSPGLVKTSIFDWKDDSLLNAIVFQIVRLFIVEIYGKTPEEGAQTTLHVALSEMCQYVTGKLFMDCKIFREPAKVSDEEFCEDIFEVSENLAKLRPCERIPRNGYHYYSKF